MHGPSISLFRDLATGNKYRHHNYYFPDGFLIQKSQNKDSLAIQLKLNELVAAHEFASNRLVNVEDMTEEELKIIQKYYCKLSEFTKNEESLQQSHSIDESKDVHDLKEQMENELEAGLIK